MFFCLNQRKAPQVGLEPTTLSLHIILKLLLGVDYITAIWLYKLTT